MDNKSGIFISQVGMQPAAVAVAISALAQERLISQVILLYTEKTTFYAENLQYWKTKRADIPAINLLKFNAGNDAAEFSVTLKTILADSPESKVYINLSGGASFYWANVSRLLLGEKNIYPVFAEIDALHVIGEKRSWPITDLGLDALFALHGVSAEWDKQEGSSVAKNLEISFLPTSGPIIFFNYAYEKKGRLYCLIENVTGLSEARRVIDLLRSPPALKKLYPNILVTTKDPNVHKRLRFSGCQTLKTTKTHEKNSLQKLQEWHAGKVRAAGTIIPLHQNFNQPPPHRPMQGKGGNGTSLLVCLGTDPAPTITALFTHQPTNVWILYDKTTPEVVSLAFNLARFVDQFPVNKMTFVPVGSGFLADGITPENLTFLNDEPDVCGNITPGTKSQSWSFGQIPKLYLVSINNRRRLIQNLIEGDVFLPDLDPGPVLLTAKIIGGSGVSMRMTEIEVSDKLPLLQGVASAIKTFSGDNGSFLFCDCKTKKIRKRGSVQLTTEWENNCIEVAVNHNGKAAQGKFSAPIEKGILQADWLEEVVAGAFMAAGGKGLCVGLTWSWDKKAPGHYFRTEIDVVFTWGTTHVVISVKAYSLKKSLEEKCCEIRAMTTECFGRFALPVLVYYAPYPENTNQVLKRFEKTGVLQVPANLLSQPQSLKDLLDKSFAQLSTHSH